MSDSQYSVQMRNITKTFPGVRALDDVSFTLRPGEVMALLGENGAGKSTLMKILSGVYTRDSGEILLFGTSIEGDLNPRKAQALGVSMIHQELNMCSHLTVAQNIFLGKELTRGSLLSEREMNQQAKDVLDSLQIDIDPTMVLGSLAVSKQQMVEIAKALQSKAKILIMDEPTSALTSVEITQLFTLIRKLRSTGCSIVYISHRLEELQHIVDRVTIMRDGKFITEQPFSSLTMNQIISYMVGREIKEKFPRIPANRGKLTLSIRNLNAGRMVRDISLDLYQGEILGIAGLMGAGRTETTRALFGVDPKESGDIVLEGKAVTITCPEDAIEAGLVLVPEDRKRDGLCIKLSVRENIGLPNLDILCNKAGIINRKRERTMVKKAVQDLGVKLPTSEVDASSLSGGNQQKVVVGKWLARDSKVVIFDEPTRGIDVAAKVEIYHLMNELKQNGIAVMFVSSEMPEILGVSDRILVMCDGRITGELDRSEATQEKIMEYATRFEHKLENQN
ncbi:sugar ABC transporter ATP-binding protein [Sphaerochaeta sp. PS]|uniref:sugar ABC transporter ATP-binding protein n=1 Tax=Sphaerochaeta sp. PS TaxID=3076336 RepID=UPI0028A2E9FB|nr:sugar ABC transporter ATP-binding protein [Sphaerochaeta sp. PS]MDT4761505.1 sugar ABC transporter ATP-binding protein [Sphaerochaeta sp. PS]